MLYDVTHPDTGDVLQLESDGPPTGQDVNFVLKEYDRRASTKGQGYWGGVGNQFAQDATKGVGEVAQGIAGVTTTFPLVTTSEYGQEPEWIQRENERRFRRTPSQVLQEVKKDPVFKWGKEVSEGASEQYPVSPENEKNFGTKIAGAAGSFLPLIASGPLAPATIALESMGGHLENDFDTLKAKGLSDEEAAQKTIDRALLSGVAQGTIFMLLPKPLRNLGDKYLIDKFGTDAMKRFVAARAAQFGEGAGLGAASTAAENVIAERPITEGVGAGATGLGVIQALTMPRGKSRAERDILGEPGYQFDEAEQARRAELPKRWEHSFQDADEKRNVNPPETRIRTGVDDYGNPIYAELPRAGEEPPATATPTDTAPKPKGPAPATPALKVSAALKILKGRGVADDVAAAIADSVGPKLPDETGEQYRARIFEAHDNAGFKVKREIVGGIDEAEKRRVLKAQGETPEGISEAIAKDKERRDVIDAENQAILKKGLKNASRVEASVEIPAGQSAESVPANAAGTSGELQKPAAALPQEAAAPEVKLPKIAPVVFKSLDPMNPNIGWFELTEPFTAPETGRTTAAGGRLNSSQIEKYGMSLEGPAKTAFEEAKARGAKPSSVNAPKTKEAAGVPLVTPAATGKAVSPAAEAIRQENLRKQALAEVERQKAASGFVGVPEENPGGVFYVGDVMDVEGERVEVTDINPNNGDVTLKDGRKFSTQKLREGQSIFVEKFEPAEVSTEFVPVEEALSEKPKPGTKPNAARRPLTETEQSEFQSLSLKSRAARESGGAPLAGAELRRYQELEALAGAQDLALESAKTFKPAEDLSLTAETATEKPPEKAAPPELDLFTEKPKASAPVKAEAPPKAPPVAAEKSSPPKQETRSSVEILNQEKRVKVTVPTGATMLRITTPDGKVSIEPLTNITKGDNVFRGSGGTKIEAGTIDRRGQFQPMKGEVKVARVDPPNPHETPESKKNSERATKLKAEERFVETEQEALDAIAQGRTEAYTPKPDDRYQIVQEGDKFAVVDTASDSRMGALSDRASAESKAQTYNEVSSESGKAIADKRALASVGPEGAAAYYHDGVVYYILDRIKSPEQFLRVQREEIAHHINSAPEAKKVLTELGRAPEFELERREIRGSYPKVESETPEQYSERIANEMLAKSRVQDAGLFQRMTDWLIEKLSNLPKIGDWIKESEANRQAILRTISRRLEKNFTAAGKTDVPLAARAEADAPPPVEESAAKPRRDSVKYHGTPAGKAYLRQSMAPVTEFLRQNYFDSRVPVTPENTANAIRLLQQFIDPAQRELTAKEIQAVAGEGRDAAIQLYQNELEDYAVKLAATGDRTLADLFIQNWGELPLTGQAFAGKSASARGLRAIQEGEAQNIFARLNLLRTESGEAARKAMGVGPELWNNLVRRLQELRIDPAETAGELGDLRVNGKSIADLMYESPVGEKKAVEEIVAQVEDRLGVGEPAREKVKQRAKDEKLTERQAKAELEAFERAQTEWLKPDGKKNQIKEIIREWLKPDQRKPQTEEEYRAQLSTAFERVEVDPATAAPLAREVWNRKQALDAAVRQRAMEREGRDIADAADRTARALADRYEMTEFPGKKAPNEIVKIIADFLKGPPDKGEPPLSDALTYEPLAKLLRDAGVRPETAGRLSGDVYQDRQKKWQNARFKAQEQVAQRGSIQSLIEQIQQTPYLAQKSQAWRLDTATNWFMANGLSREQAEAAAKTFNAEFEKKLVEAGERVAKSVLTKDAPKSVADIIRGIRSGLLDPDKTWSDAIANRDGWKPLTRDQFRKLAELELESADESLSPPEFADVQERMMDIIRRSGPDSPDGTFQRRLNEGFVASLLSGIRTFTVQWQPVLMAIRDFPIMAANDPRNALNYLTALKNAAKETFLPEFKFAWQKDAYSYHLEAIDRQHKELKQWWEKLDEEYKATSNPVKKAGIRARQLYAAQQYVSRTLSTLDQTMMASTREWKLPYYASLALKRAGLSTSGISTLMDAIAVARQTEFEKAIDAGLDVTTAKVRANARVEQAVWDFVRNETGSETLANQALKAAEDDLYSMVGRRAEGVKETDEGFLSRLGVNQFMQWMSQIRGEGGLPSLMAVAGVGFFNVPFRTSRFVSNFHPYGLLRYGIYRYRTNRGLDNYWKQTFGNELQARARLREAIAGTVALTLGAAWAAFHRTSDDDAGNEALGMYFTGNGPSNKNLRDAWLKQGWKPYSLHFVIAGRKVAIPMTRIGEAFMFPAMLPAAMDDIAWRAKEFVAAGHAPPTIGREVGMAIGTHLGMMGQKGFLQQITQFQQAVQGGTDPTKAAAKLVTAAVSASILPFKQALQSASDMFVGPMDQSSATAIIAANFPIVGLPFQKRAINRFGDELYDQSWYGKIAKTGVPFAFQVAKTPQNSELYQLMVEKGAAPPELRRYILEERFGPLTDEQFKKFSKQSGELLKAATLDNISDLRGMSPEDAKKQLGKLATQANRQTELDMGLERAKPLTATGGGGGYAPATRSVSATPRTTAPRMATASAPAFTSSRGSRRLSLRGYATRGRTRGLRTRRLGLRSVRSGGRLSRRRTLRLRRPRLSLV